MVAVDKISEVLHRHFRTLRSILANMRSLQRMLIDKDFDTCFEIMNNIRHDQEVLEESEKERLNLLQSHSYAHNIRVEQVTGEDIAALFPASQQREIRLLLSQIKEITIHIRLLSQSVYKFSNAIGNTIKSAFEGIFSTKEYGYTEHGHPQSRDQNPFLYDVTR